MRKKKMKQIIVTNGAVGLKMKPTFSDILFIIKVPDEQIQQLFSLRNKKNEIYKEYVLQIKNNLIFKNESKINTNHESIYKSIFGLSNGNLVGISCNLYLSNDTEELKIKRPIIFHIGRTPSSRNDLKIIMEILLKNKVKLNNEWKNWYIENC
jgi:transcriptional regulator with PAS, ATPase and Fis domain